MTINETIYFNLELLNNELIYLELKLQCIEDQNNDK